MVSTFLPSAARIEDKPAVILTFRFGVAFVAARFQNRQDLSPEEAFRFIGGSIGIPRECQGNCASGKEDGEDKPHFLK